jgi:restriction endonuclease S subunit
MGKQHGFIIYSTRLDMAPQSFYIRAKPEILDPQYLFYLVGNSQFRLIGESAMKGAAGQKRISADFQGL